jgi:hypothetical protein
VNFNQRFGLKGEEHEIMNEYILRNQKSRLNSEEKEFFGQKIERF